MTIDVFLFNSSQELRLLSSASSLNYDDALFLSLSSLLDNRRHLDRDFFLERESEKISDSFSTLLAINSLDAGVLAMRLMSDCLCHDLFAISLLQRPEAVESLGEHDEKCLLLFLICFCCSSFHLCLSILWFSWSVIIFSNVLMSLCRCSACSTLSSKAKSLFVTADAVLWKWNPCIDCLIWSTIACDRCSCRCCMPAIMPCFTVAMIGWIQFEFTSWIHHIHPCLNLYSLLLSSSLPLPVTLVPSSRSRLHLLSSILPS